MEITISDAVRKINEAIAGGNGLADQYKEKAFTYHDYNSQIIQEQIIQGTPGEKKIYRV